MKTNNLKWVPCAANGSAHDYVNESLNEINRSGEAGENNVHAGQPGPHYYAIHHYEQNDPFPELLTFEGFSFGRSSGRAQMRGETGKLYSMFIGEFERILLTGRVAGTKIVGRWMYAKMGANIGLIESPAPIDAAKEGK